MTREVRQLNPAVRILVMIKQKVKKEKVMLEFGTPLFHQLPIKMKAYCKFWFDGESQPILSIVTGDRQVKLPVN